VPAHCILNAEIHYSFIDWSAKQPECKHPIEYIPDSLLQIAVKCLQ
jgi:hypothetical protein